MQIAFFLLPKSETIFLLKNHTVRQALEKMQYHEYVSVPLLNQEGQYVGAITVADLLWYIKDAHDMSLADAEKVSLSQVPRLRDNKPVSINAKVSDLFTMAMEQNFIPVVDDLGVFIGIVRRRDLMDFYQKKLKLEDEDKK